MPQELQLVYLKATGEPKLMHSVDAAEAVRLGDYVSVLPGPETGTAEAQAAARSLAMTRQGPVHPEMMTQEQRDVARHEANQAEIRRLEKAGEPVPEALHQAVAEAPLSIRPEFARMRMEESVITPPPVDPLRSGTGSGSSSGISGARTAPSDKK